jgi:hypothetical protein
MISATEKQGDDSSANGSNPVKKKLQRFLQYKEVTLTGAMGCLREINRDYALHKGRLKKQGIWAEQPLLLLFPLGGLLWLGRFDKGDFPHHIVEV